MESSKSVLSLLVGNQSSSDSKNFSSRNLDTDASPLDAAHLASSLQHLASFIFIQPGSHFGHAGEGVDSDRGGGGLQAQGVHARQQVCLQGGVLRLLSNGGQLLQHLILAPRLACRQHAPCHGAACPSGACQLPVEVDLCICSLYDPYHAAKQLSFQLAHDDVAPVASYCMCT